MDILKKITHVLSIFCYVIIGIFALICSPMIFGSQPVVVLSGSMQPTYNKDTIIYYKKVPDAEIREGDIVSYQLKDEVVTHRVKRLENGRVVTQGDANNKEDEPIAYDAIVGKVGGIAIPFLGLGVRMIKSSPWVFAIPVVILMLEFLLSNIKNGKISVSENKERNNNEE